MNAVLDGESQDHGSGTFPVNLAELGRGSCSFCSRVFSVTSAGNVHVHGPQSNR